MQHGLTRILLCAFVCGVLLSCAPQSTLKVGDNADQSSDTTQNSTLSVTFMATTTLVFSDAETTLITDGFFTRPDIAWPPPEFGVIIEPDRDAISSALAMAKVENAAAVMVVHSHYDHSLDSPIVAQLTGADLLGSESTANIGRGLNLDEQRIRVIVPGEPMRYGQFTVTFYISKHWPIPEHIARTMGDQRITEPLVPPAPFDAYKEGGTYSILLQHPDGNYLIQGSAGYLPGALEEVEADAVFLSVGGLGDLPAQEQENYFTEIVSATGARQIYPIHWDSTTTPLDEPLVPYEDFERAMAFLHKKQDETGVSVILLPLGESMPLVGKMGGGDDQVQCGFLQSASARKTIHVHINVLGNQWCNVDSNRKADRFA